MLNQVVIFSYLDYHKGVWFDWKVGDEDRWKLIPLTRNILQAQKETERLKQKMGTKKDIWRYSGGFRILPKGMPYQIFYMQFGKFHLAIR